MRNWRVLVGGYPATNRGSAAGYILRHNCVFPWLGSEVVAECGGLPRINSLRSVTEVGYKRLSVATHLQARRRRQ